ncbi:MAG: mechanosensitive ion channel family protein [Smithella sp.]
MNFLDKIFFGNSVIIWLIAFAIMFVIFLILILTRKMTIHHLSKLAARTITQIDDMMVAVIFKTKKSFLFIAAAYISSNFLVITPKILNIWNKIFFIAVAVQIGFWLSEGIRFMISLNVKKRMTDNVASAATISILGFISKFLLWSIILLLILDNMGINITSLVTGLGIGGVAVALAVQNILGDLFASLSIVVDKPFVAGDFIIIDQFMGTVENIGLKTTRLRSLSGEQLIFSNTDLLKSRIRNYKRMTERRIVFGFGITYQTPPDKLILINDMVREAIQKQPQVRFDRVHFKEYGDSALNFEAVYYVLHADFNIYMDIQQAINLELFQRFGQEKIEFAYPTRTIFVQQQTAP